MMFVMFFWMILKQANKWHGGYSFVGHFLGKQLMFHIYGFVWREENSQINHYVSYQYGDGLVHVFGKLD